MSYTERIYCDRTSSVHEFSAHEIRSFVIVSKVCTFSEFVWMTYSAVPPPPDLTRDSAVSPYMKNRTLSDIRAITATVWNMTET